MEMSFLKRSPVFFTKLIFEQQQNTKIPGAAAATGAAGASKSVGAGQKAPDPGPTKLAGALGRGFFSIQNVGSLGDAGESHLGMG